MDPTATLKTRISVPLAVLALATAEVHANEGQPPESELETLTVTATKSERQINEIAATVTAIQAEQIDSLAAHNIRDLFRYEPGVNVEGSGRYGLSNINIRGINGDRVLILLDNVPVADEFSFGPNLSSRRDFVDIDLIQQVQIIRGPASTLYGSDAIGGVVSFISKDPADLVADGESFAGRVKLGYVSQADETNINGQLAGVNGDWQWLLNGGYRDAAETESFFSSSALQGAAQQSSNPQDIKSNNTLLKVIWEPSPLHKVTFVGESFNADVDTDITADIGAVSMGVVTQQSTGEDERERERYSLQYRYQPSESLIHRISLDAFGQSSETRQNTSSTRATLAEVPQLTARTRDSYFKQDTKGFLGQVDMQFSGVGEHYAIAGIEWQETDSEALREGQTIDIQTGATMPEFSVFPARDFPISTLKELAVYVQDEIQLFDTKVTLSPGIRYDSFKLEANADPIFESANPGVVVTGYDDSEVSAKLGAIYQLGSASSAWLQWAQGFRIPPMDDINIGFTNFMGGYTSLANPDLKPETVDSIELGWRQDIGAFSWSISAYSNTYQNFIESLAVLGFNPITNLLEFQARNIDDVTIKGVDVSTQWQLANWQVRLAGSWQESEDKATGQALESVLPSQTVLGVQYGDLDDPWRVELVTTYIERANAIAVDSGAPEPFVAPSAVLADLLVHYQITPATRVNFGMFNITDKQYWYAAEVRGRTSDSNLDRFTASGRNVSANVVVNF